MNYSQRMISLGIATAGRIIFRLRRLCRGHAALLALWWVIQRARDVDIAPFAAPRQAVTDKVRRGFGRMRRHDGLDPVKTQREQTGGFEIVSFASVLGSPTNKETHRATNPPSPPK